MNEDYKDNKAENKISDLKKVKSSDISEKTKQSTSKKLEILGLCENHLDLENKNSPLRKKGYVIKSMMESGLNKEELRIFFPENIFEEICSFCKENPSNEVMGEILGDIFIDKDGPYLFVNGHIASKYIESSRTGAKDTTASKEYMIDKRLELFPNDKTIGWYHTHPDMGAFLSKVDIETKKVVFPLWYQIAMVFDPIREEIGIWFGSDKNLRSVDGLYLFKENPRPEITISNIP